MKNHFLYDSLDARFIVWPLYGGCGGAVAKDSVGLDCILKIY